ncbi:MAG: methylated-DNA--[protein]-cysteine S-methyltransferase, partial [Actinomycetota bacterium]|nr:methylated-DNA--[protein]-cysteine S-methyltransferase [Actinomycetota bacterium]
LPPGRTVTYAQLASRAGYAGAARAAGAACGANLLAPVVPCHRAVRSDGTVGGYAYGPAVKGWLLDHEQRHLNRDV